MKTKAIGQVIRKWFVSPDRLFLLRWSGWFFIFTNGILLTIGLLYLLNYSFPSQSIALLYTFSAYTSHISSMGILAWISMIPVIIIFPIRVFIMPFSIFLASFISALLLLDGLLFAENQFHIGMLTLTILGWKTWAFGLVYVIIFITFTTLLSQWIHKQFLLKKRLIPGISIVILQILFLLLSHGLHMWADAVYYVPITKFTTILPLYFPTSARDYLEGKGYIPIEEARNKKILTQNGQPEGTLHYPLDSLIFGQRNEELKNVLIILIDALRTDVISQECMPNLYRLRTIGMAFTNHYSGGNSTRMGIFSLFYGIPSTYWQYIEGIQQPPLLMEIFQKYNYQMGIFSSGPLNRPASLDRTVFASIKNLRNQSLTKSHQPYEKDSAITDDWITWLHSKDGKNPFFGFLFYDAPCAKNFPSSYAGVLEKFDKRYDNEKQRNRYRTAANYTDSLIGLVYDDLKKRELLDKTIIIITADHGEEFNDSKLGYTGHGSNYTDYQLKVPMILHWPGKGSASFQKRTSHNDVPALLLNELFACQNPPSDYCSGTNLLSGPEWQWLIVGSYYNYAILEKDQVTVNYPGGYFEIRDKNYQVISKKNLHKQVLVEAINETKRFFSP